MADLALGDEVAGYRIDARLARGGMGVVYRATHLGLDRPVALKVIARELAGDASFRERFLRESRLAARLDHPAVVPVYDSREVDGELIVAMRLVEGGDLRGLIDREGPLPPARATALLGQVAAALDAAHAAGIVHRDVKPHNVLVEGERAYLSDFGLAKAIDESGARLDRLGGRHRRLHVAGAVARRGGRPARRHLLARLRPLRGGDRGRPLRPRRRRPGDDAAPARPASRARSRRATAPNPADRFAHRDRADRRGARRSRRRRAPDATAVDPTSPRVDPADRAERCTERRGRPRPGAAGRRRSRRSVALAGGALVLAAAIVAAVLLLTGGSSGPTVSAPVAIGKPPLRIAAGSEKIWVLSEPEGTLTRIDAETDRITGAPIDLGQGVAAVAVGGGSVWVTDARTGELLRVDDETGRVTQRIEIGGHPGPIAYGGGRVWVADTEGAGITAVNTKGGRVVRRDLAPHTAPLRLATGAGGLWVSSAATDTVRRIDLATFAVGTPIPAGRRPAGITVADGLVWVADTRSDSVTRVDPSLQAVSGAPIPVGEHPGGIDAGTSAVWVTSRAPTRSAVSTSRPANRTAARSPSAPNPARSRSARPRSGSSTTVTAR